MGENEAGTLAALLRLCIRNREHIEGLIYGRWWGALAYRLRHLRRALEHVLHRSKKVWWTTPGQICERVASPAAG